MARYVTTIVTTKKGKEKKRFNSKVSQVNGAVIKAAAALLINGIKMNEDSDFIKALKHTANNEPIAAIEALIKHTMKGNVSTIVHNNKKAMIEFNRGE